MEITTCILSGHVRLKLDINNRKLTNSWKPNNSLVNKKWVKTEIKKKKTVFIMIEKETTTKQKMGHKAVLRGKVLMLNFYIKIKSWRDPILVTYISTHKECRTKQ